MKTIVKPKKAASKHRSAVTRVKSVASVRLTDEAFRRQLHIELADEIAAARKNTQQRLGHLLRPRTPAESKANAASARAMFAQWEKEDRKDPPPYNDWDKFKALLEENRMRSAPLFAE